MFNIATPWVAVCWPNDDDPPDRTLHRPYFELGRSEVTDETGTSVEWYLRYGDWIRLFRDTGLLVEDLIELRPAPDATTTYTTYTTLEWARDFPGDHIWKVRKQTRRPTPHFSSETVRERPVHFFLRFSGLTGEPRIPTVLA